MRIALLGDTALFGINTIYDKQYKKRFSPIKEVLDLCDYVIANLESPLTSETKNIGGKSAYLKGSPADVDILKYLGVSHVTLANNHMFDYRAQGMNETISILERNGIVWYGANGKNVIIEESDNKLILMGYCCYSTNGKGLGNKSPCINIFDPRIVENTINSYIREGYLPIISVHWGQEHVHYPNYDHVEVARRLCRNKKIIIHGHHPHVIQGIEKLGESIVAYSLGNFCFDDVYTNKSKEPLVKLSRDNKESFIIILTIDGNEIKDCNIIPFSFEDYEYKIDNTILPKIHNWSEFLSVPRSTYMEKRRLELTEYLDKRKKMRDFHWYLKRMNFDSVSMILGARNNQKMYNRLVSSYISKD